MQGKDAWLAICHLVCVLDWDLLVLASGCLGFSSYGWGVIVVRQNSYAVLDDNRNASCDRHSWGFLLCGALVGKAIQRCHRLDRAGSLVGQEKPGPRPCHVAYSCDQRLSDSVTEGKGEALSLGCRIAWRRRGQARRSELLVYEKLASSWMEKLYFFRSLVFHDFIRRVYLSA